MFENMARDSAVRIHEEDAAKFESWYQARVYDNVFQLGRSTMEPYFQRALSFLAPAAQILDAGCGVGQQIQGLQARGFEVYGIDPAESMIALAKEKVPFRVRLGSLLEIPFPDATFDMVYSLEVFRYLQTEDNLQGLREALRVLKPGGILFASFVNKFAMDGFYLLESWRRLMRRSRCHHEFETPMGLAKKLVSVGFVQVETHGSLQAWLRLLYKANTTLGAGVAKAVGFLDPLCDWPGFRPFSGHLMATARKPMGSSSRDSCQQRTV